tara:strand:- start:144 stop:902 length:759 start_codon:yes stop_codon:yes gene_type:complete
MSSASILLSGPIGLRLLKNFKKQNLKADAIIIDKNSNKSYINEVKKINVSKNIFISGRIFSKNLKSYIKKNTSIILSFWWPYIIKKEYLSLTRFGVVNPHSSYLPYERGVHSYVYSILRNHPKGVTIHFMDKKVDAGLIINQKKIKTKHFITGSELELVLRDELIKFFTNHFKKLVTLNFKRNELKRIDTKKHLQNFRKNLDKNTLIKLNKNYKASDLINLILSRSGFKNGGAHFIYKKKKYEISMKIRKKI